MPYVVLLKTGYYLAEGTRTSDKSKFLIECSDLWRAIKFDSKQEAQSKLKEYKNNSKDASMSGVIRKV